MRNLTRWIVVSTVVGLSLYDLLPIFNKRPGDTISEVVRDGAKAYPIVAFAFGALFGHLFWPLKEHR